MNKPETSLTPQEAATTASKFYKCSEVTLLSKLCHLSSLQGVLLSVNVTVETYQLTYVPRVICFSHFVSVLNFTFLSDASFALSDVNA